MIEDTKKEIRSRKSKKDRQYNEQTKERAKGKGQTTIYKTVHRKLNIEQCEPHYNPGIISGAPKLEAVPALLVAHILLIVLSNDKS
jgi:hypothetical protein